MQRTYIRTHRNHKEQTNKTSLFQNALLNRTDAIHMCKIDLQLDSYPMGRKSLKGCCMRTARASRDKCWRLFDNGNESRKGCVVVCSCTCASLGSGAYQLIRDTNSVSVFSCKAYTKDILLLLAWGHIFFTHKIKASTQTQTVLIAANNILLLVGVHLYTQKQKSARKHKHKHTHNAQRPLLVCEQM